MFDVVFLDAEKDDYEALFALARERVEPGGLVVADNVLSHVETLGAYSAARQADPTLSSVTVPLDRGLELTTILTSGLTAPYHWITTERRWSDLGNRQNGQWRYSLVGACPRDPRGIA